MPPKRKTIRIEPMNPIPEQIVANEQPLENKHDEVPEDNKQDINPPSNKPNCLKKNKLIKKKQPNAKTDISTNNNIDYGVSKDPRMDRTISYENDMFLYLLVHYIKKVVDIK